MVSILKQPCFRSRFLTLATLQIITKQSLIRQLTVTTSMDGAHSLILYCSQSHCMEAFIRYFISDLLFKRKSHNNTNHVIIEYWFVLDGIKRIVSIV